MGNSKAGMMNTKYVTLTIEEYFNVIEKQNSTNSKIVAKSLVKYLKSNKEKALAA